MKVYMTKRNSDMTEGRGTMIDDLCFTKREYAEQYIDVQPGIMGREMKWSEENYGDWIIEEIEVLECSVIDIEQERKKTIEKALSKLTDKEIEALVGVKK